MNLHVVSLTGADDRVTPAGLRALSEQFPVVEWAILSSQKQQGSSRYPTEEWVSAFHLECPDAHKAIHLCGRDVDAFLSGAGWVLDKVSRFDRIQLNFNQRRQPKDLEALVRVANGLEQTIILQHNSANVGLWDELRNEIPRLAILFDASGGRGQSPESGWPAMLPDTVCGFAGGLGPHNVAAELTTIAGIAAGQRFWIDMESKLRAPADDKFLLDACRDVLAATASYNM
jgi:hypothetical protein